MKSYQRPHFVVPEGAGPYAQHMTDLERAVEAVIRDCLAVREGEQVLVVCNPATLGLGERLRGAAGRAGADAMLAMMAERATHGTEPPGAIAAAHEGGGCRPVPDDAVALAHRGAPRGMRGGRPHRHAAARHRGHPRPGDARRHGRAQAPRPGGGEDPHRRGRGPDHLPQRQRPAPEPRGADRRSPTTATSRLLARSATCRAARGSSRRATTRARERWSSTARWARSGFPPSPRG